MNTIRAQDKLLSEEETAVGTRTYRSSLLSEERLNLS